MTRIDTVIIGGGQAGLTMSHHLSQHGRPHVVLERHRIAERWRSERWDSLRFQFPNWAMRLPEFEYAGNDPDAYAHRDEVIRFIEAYAAFIRAPVRTGVDVQRLRPGPDGFILETSDTTIEAANVVIATGPYQQPAIPAAAAGKPFASVSSSTASPSARASERGDDAAAQSRKAARSSAGAEPRPAGGAIGVGTGPRRLPAPSRWGMPGRRLKARHWTPPREWRT